MHFAFKSSFNRSVAICRQKIIEMRFPRYIRHRVASKRVIYGSVSILYAVNNFRYYLVAKIITEWHNTVESFDASWWFLNKNITYKINE